MKNFEFNPLEVLEEIKNPYLPNAVQTLAVIHKIVTQEAKKVFLLYELSGTECPNLPKNLSFGDPDLLCATACEATEALLLICCVYLKKMEENHTLEAFKMHPFLREYIDEVIKK